MEDLEPLQTFVMESLTHQATLLGTKFRNITSLYLFVRGNQSNADLTYLNDVCLTGSVSKAYAH